MTEAYIGQITLFTGNYAPYGWSFCNGQIIPIQQNTALFSIIGNMYGGDGRTNFALPNFQGRVPMHQGRGAGLAPRNIAETGGNPTVTLNTNQMPAHTHVPGCSVSGGEVGNPVNAIWSATPSTGRGQPGPSVYAPQPTANMNANAIQPVGGSQPHNNMQPYLPLNFIICVSGLFPPRD